VRQEAPALDEHTERRGKDHDPARIGMLRNENRALLQIDARWIDDDSDGAANDSGRAAKAAALVAGVRRNRRGAAEIMAVVERSARFESVVGRGLALVAAELCPAHGRKAAKVGGRGPAVDESQDLVDLQIQHVAWIVQHIDGV